jgi:hypothetical protein
MESSVFGGLRHIVAQHWRVMLLRGGTRNGTTVRLVSPEQALHIAMARQQQCALSKSSNQPTYVGF